MLSLLLLGALGSADAAAAEGLAWKWDGPRRYWLHTEVGLPGALPFRATENVDVLVHEFALTAATTCSPTRPIGKTKWQITCDIDDAAIIAVPSDGSTGRAQIVVDEWAKTLEDHASVTFVLGADGRLAQLELDGLDKSNRRTAEIAQTLREMVLRAFATMDLALPKQGSDGGNEWTQRGAVAMGFLSSTGTIGAAVVRHRVTGAEGGLVEITSTGEGSMAQSSDNPVTFLFDLSGGALFDTATGTLSQRWFQSKAVQSASSVAIGAPSAAPTAGSAMSPGGRSTGGAVNATAQSVSGSVGPTGGGGMPVHDAGSYVQFAVLRHVPAGEAMPDVGTSLEAAPPAAP